MEKKINFNKNEEVQLTQGQKLEYLARTIKSLKEIKTDVDLQTTYTRIFWKKIWEYTNGKNQTINKTEYTEFVKLTNKIADLQHELSHLTTSMINSVIEKIENV